MKYVRLREKLKYNTEKIISMYLFEYSRTYLTFKNIYTKNELNRLFLMKHTLTHTHTHAHVHTHAHAKAHTHTHTHSLYNYVSVNRKFRHKKKNCFCS